MLSALEAVQPADEVALASVIGCGCVSCFSSFENFTLSAALFLTILHMLLYFLYLI